MRSAVSLSSSPRLEKAWVRLLGLYLFGLILGDRTFAYWHIGIGPFPLYVSEGVLAALTAGILTGVVPGAPAPISKAERVAWAVFLAAAFQSAVRGFLHFPAADALRDCALVYYCGFYFVARWAASDGDRLKKIACVAVLAIVGKDILGVIQLSTLAPWSSQPAAMSMYFSIFILSAFALAPVEGRLALPLSVIAGISGGLLFLYQVRTSWVGFAAGAVVLFAVLRPSLRRAHFRFGAVALVLTLLIPVFWKILDRGRVSDSVDEVLTFGSLMKQPAAIVDEAFQPKPASAPAVGASTSVVVPEEKPLIETKSSLGTSRTRLWMWGDMLIELRRDGTWLPGVAMGKPWLPPRIIPWWNLKVTKRVDPHNSFLALLYRTGIFGLTAFLFIMLATLRRAARAARSLPEGSVNRLVIAAAMAGAVYCLGHAATDVTFENPFKGIFVWIMLGVASGLAREA